MKITHQLFVTFVLVIGFLLGASALSAFAQVNGDTWTGPSCPPPQCNVDAPLNVGTSTQIKYGNLVLNGLSVNAATILSGLLQIAVGNPQAGDVLTAQDASGTVGWQPSTGSGAVDSYNFITPVTVATIAPGTTVPWTTVSLAGDGVSTTASAIILQARGTSYNQPYAEIDERATTSSPAYTLLYMGTSQYSVNTSSAQGAFPFTVSGDVPEFSYEVPGSFGNGGGIPNSTISLIGYIGPAPSSLTTGTLACSVVSGSNNSATLSGSASGGVIPYSYTLNMPNYPGGMSVSVTSPGTYGSGQWHNINMTGANVSIVSADNQMQTVACSAS